MGVVNMANPFHVNDFFSNSPALSLTLGTVAEKVDLCNGEEQAVEIISSENSAPARTRSDEDPDDNVDGGDQTKNKNKRRKKYHRHTADQIREMETLYKESPHPDDNQRQQLSKQLGLSPQQVKFWFQNRRTQIKSIQERNENSILKTEMEKIRKENNSLREAIKKVCCPNCGFAKEKEKKEDHLIRIENAQLTAEIQKLQAVIQNDISGMNDRSRVVKLVSQATEELITMATLGEPLWMRSVETGREILNYDEYKMRFPPPSTKTRHIEVSRETGVVFADITMLLKCFLDVNHWKEMFPCIISKADTIDVVELGHHRNNGVVQLMFAELQMLTPIVPTREVRFVRHCKQLSAEKWVIVDVSIDNTIEDNNINDIASVVKFIKRPSGCIIEDKSNGCCKVTWVEHLEYCQNMSVPTMYRQIINDGTAFGAKRWLSTLQQQCERLIYFMATNVPSKDSNEIATLTGRKSILRLAHRMSQKFCREIGASNLHKWTKLPNTKEGDEIRVSYRKNLNDPEEPIGVILCAVSSVWLNVSHIVLADFLTDASRRHEWDMMSNGNPAQSLANLAKGQDRGNSVTIQKLIRSEKGKEKRILQDRSSNACESLVVYAALDVATLQSAMQQGGEESGAGVAMLPCGFCIHPDGMESRPMVITRSKVEAGGCFLTLAFQVLASSCPTDELSIESAVESVTDLVSCTLTNIKTIFNYSQPHGSSPPNLLFL
ncbi:homeobox-leucine zipper protein GLABRA 2-like isoform X2 [Impatiens glandulifera]|uniref:homeobox-leucine zipper protein GLABRA 2-like isoform X2 n=1 Tax=Impatiens glandulifera TaxID=253017 RepID=UPI001FB0CE7D|nr:homeobox-leucine zipper protein GLABRA 2-like isoform X2 [Impatiens glandulifera]